MGKGNYNLVQKLGKIQNWEYGPRVISLFGGAPCVHSHGLCGFAGVNKITALPSPDGCGNAHFVFSFSQHRTAQCCDRNGSPFARKYNQQSRALARYTGFKKWEINIEKYHGWSSKKVQKECINQLFK